MAAEDGRPKVLTIDGPAGVGKSSVARRVAQRLRFFHLDTGSMYRAVTLAALRAGVAAGEATEAALAPVLEQWVASRRMRVGAGGRVWLEDEDVSEAVRGAAVTACVSPVSALPSVRAALVAWQRELGRARAGDSGGVVVEGRDAGSAIFPEARWRFYLDASLQERARRRLRQDGEAAPDPQRVTATMESLAQRDRIDRERPVAPLCIPAGALVLDTTSLPLEQVVDAIVARVSPGSARAS